MDIPRYPTTIELHLELREILHPLLCKLADGISEFTFANLYLFRKTHHYRIAWLDDNLLIIVGQDDGKSFFMLPFALPDPETLHTLFSDFSFMKGVSSSQSTVLLEQNYLVSEDRDNFDYLYLRKDLSELSGRKYHKKRNLIKAFISRNAYEGRPLLEELKNDAIAILEAWRSERSEPGDYEAAREGLEKMEELQLCGGIYYVDGQPVAYSLGEELNLGRTFAIHFEKAAGDYKGIWQFVNQAFASILPEKYETINREQDLGNEGLRQAKLSYNPIGFVKKYRAQSRGRGSLPG